MTRTLRTAVIGLGRIGWQFHLPEVKSHEGFELVAVVDPLADRREEAETTYDVHAYADAEALLDKENLDLVVIASPTPFHADQTVAAFEHGCDVFCDKPMAPKLAEAERMIAAMAAHDRKLMIYQPHRARVEVVALQDILRRRLIGPLYMLKRGRSDYYRRNDWQAFSQYGGGMLNNYGAHYIDELIYLAGSSAKRVSCALRTIASLGDAEDVVKTVIETQSGVILDVDINMAAAHAIRPWHILGAHGSIVMTEDEAAWHVRYYRPDELGDGVVHTELVAPERKYGNIDESIPWREEIVPFSDYEPVDFYAQCYEYYALDKPPFVPIEETHDLMRVLNACRRDAGA
ncbi:MAG: Gfo/Idh/MocA family protein [Anaerolineae bacterium]